MFNLDEFRLNWLEARSGKNSIETITKIARRKPALAPRAIQALKTIATGETKTSRHNRETAIDRIYDIASHQSNGTIVLNHKATEEERWHILYDAFHAMEEIAYDKNLPDDLRGAAIRHISRNTLFNWSSAPALNILRNTATMPHNSEHLKKQAIRTLMGIIPEDAHQRTAILFALEDIQGNNSISADVKKETNLNAVIAEETKTMKGRIRFMEQHRKEFANAPPLKR